MPASERGVERNGVSISAPQEVQAPIGGPVPVLDDPLVDRLMAAAFKIAKASHVDH